VLDLLQQGKSSREIAQAVGLMPGQVAAIKAHVTMGTYNSETAEPQELAEAIDTTFGLERDLQRALRANVAQIETGLKSLMAAAKRRSPQVG